MTRLVMTFALAAYNNVTNLWRPFHGTAYVPMNVATTAILLGIAVGPLGLSWRSLGIASISFLDMALGFAIGALLAGALFAVAMTGTGARLIADRRVADLRGKKLAYQMLVRVPVGTALLEEVAFRGVLFAAWRDLGATEAAVISSAVFGLWHIVPAKIMVQANSPGTTRSAVVVRLAVTVIVMTAAGLVLVWLRMQTGSLGAPFALHATVNSLATGAGVLAVRRGAGARSGAAAEIERHFDHV